MVMEVGVDGARIIGPGEGAGVAGAAGTAGAAEAPEAAGATGASSADAGTGVENTRASAAAPRKMGVRMGGFRERGARAAVWLVDDASCAPPAQREKRQRCEGRQGAQIGRAS